MCSDVFSLDASTTLDPKLIFLWAFIMLSRTCVTHYKIISSEYTAGDIGEELASIHAFMNKIREANIQRTAVHQFTFISS